MIDNKGCIIVVSAPSGAGKTTIVKNILKEFPEIVFSISATTRKKRKGETNSVEYFFITEEEFLQKIRDDEFIEWEKFYDYYYGSLKSFVNENVEQGKCVLFEVDVKGALSIKRIYPDSILIYILPPSLEELTKRLKNRMTETEEDLQKRIARAEMELSLKDEFDNIVINDELEKAISEVKEIIKNKINKEEKI